MGGGGGSRYTGPTSEHVRAQVEKAREIEKNRLINEINELLKKRLAKYNDRDIDKINERLDQIAAHLDKIADLETILFGGSVAKQTAIQGVSDIDALVILDDDVLAKSEPANVLNLFIDRLRKSLPRREIELFEKGSLAVTIKYTDGTEIQLLPALRSGDKVKISSADGKRWIQINPMAFRKALTDSNQQMNQALIPSIKLIKALISGLPQKNQITGYHAEALAIDAIRDYSGDKTPRSLVIEILKHSSKRVMEPIRDITGQSRNVDDYLGSAKSDDRRNVAQALSIIAKRLESATSVRQWETVLGEGEI